MGMTGVVFVRPTDGPKFAYNDASTAFDREFSLLLNEIDVRPHDLLIGVQEFVWSEYRPQYWIINGRAYPDTIKPNKGEPGADPDLENQPISSLIQARAGDTRASARREPRLRAALDGPAGHHDEGGRRGRHAPPGSDGHQPDLRDEHGLRRPGRDPGRALRRPRRSTPARRRGAPRTAPGTRTSSRTATTTG